MANDDVLRTAAPEAIHDIQLHEMHKAFLSSPALLTHASNPVFVAPSFDAFVKACNPKIDVADRDRDLADEPEDLENAFVQALDLNSNNDTDMLKEDVDMLSAASASRQKVLEVKNEEFYRVGKAEVAALRSRFCALQVLHLSMNKIQRIDASITDACPNLLELVLADNLLKQIHPLMFTAPRNSEDGKCRLQVLDLSINQINCIENLQKLRNLQELNLR